jgi:hypothetical protein
VSEKPNVGIAVEKWIGDGAELMVVGCVHDGGVAETAGIQSADIIEKIGGLLPLEWFRDAPREGAVRVVLERAGRKLTRYFEFAAAPAPGVGSPIGPGAADPFRGMFADKPATMELPAGVETELVGVGPGCRLEPRSPLLPARRGVDADHTEIFRKRERARERRPAAPPMTNLPADWKWLD